MNRRKSSSATTKKHPSFNDSTELKSKASHRRHPLFTSASSIFLVALLLLALLACYTNMYRSHEHQLRAHTDVQIPASESHELSISVSNELPKQNTISKTNDGRTIHSLADLTQSQLHPKATSTRHMVTPPEDVIPITLVTCETTKGFLHIIVHPSWAPLGASRFSRMVTTKYFSSKVAMMRCLKGFLCQFGIAGDPSYNKEYVGKNQLKDDPNWLPEGPKYRTNELGVKRFSKGYMAYAGAGKNSRSNQLIVALDNNEGLGGGSPWEVPWGEVVGDESFATLDKIYTGYGEKGPSQGRLSKEGSSEAIAKEFPNLDYILGCEVVEVEKQ